ncbi:MAG: hypothetical protein KC478_07570 [Bacteriovoracaceae bacterium]|nr:hypothetical protein [Bacteriovoracaceae bacterium]
MKKFIASRKNVLLSVLASAILVVPFGASEYIGSKINSTRNLNAGSSTCFTRVGQTFTALMIKDFSSPYLAKDFMSMTGECFAQLNKSFISLYGNSYAAAGKPLNKLNSDLFWFHEKSEKLLEMAKKGTIQLTVGSNILNKYSELETLNFNLQEKLDVKIKTLNTWRNFSLGLSIFGAFLMAALSLMISRTRQKEVSFFKELDDQAKDVLDNFNDVEMSSIKTQRLMERLFSRIQSPFCFELYNQVQTDLLESREHSFTRVAESSSEAALSEVQADEVDSDVEKVDFNNSARALIDRMSSKIFTHGIAIEENLEEDFHVQGNGESLEQLLYNLFSFAMESSLSQESGRKISIRSKALGGISYCKVRIANCLLNPDEMEFFNGSKEIGSNNVNLVLLKELASDLNVTLAAKNILNSNGNFSGAEVELVFKRIKTADKAEAVKKTGLKTLMKGTKKDILKAMRSEA